MTGSRRLAPPRRLLAACCLGLAVLLGGCAGTAGRDIVTASDETDAQKRARIRLELASGYFARGQLETALDEVKQAIQADPNRAEAYSLRGLIYAALGDERFADESFRRALQLNPRDGNAAHNHAWFLCQRGRFAEAMTQFDAALAAPLYRDASKTLLAKGVCQARAGELAEAEKTLVRGYELDPGNPATGVNLALVLLRRGEAERARFYVRRVNSVPEYVTAETLWLAARIEHRLGNRVGAEEFGSQLRRRFPQSAQAAAYDKGLFE
ncbi:type IV pilus biogenesis/stability protein PilW [Caldimonas tepidiphila]|uniref:type IV pilus biogenesis/stability protein PilW n=1 Tax=Caldimonas tepidiphila TaxID=2315841 RepID=UPI000E5B5969|nr:type IV pilus biogenesis/stability protein PilW [Caldimonas tepidiphila]